MVRKKMLFCIAAIGFLSTCVFAAAPKVVKTFPENGDMNVKPGPTNIRIMFDQDMESGMSICGSGEHFPEITGKAKWVNKRVDAFTTTLKPNHSYTFSVNSPSFQNFRSLRGEPAEITIIEFSTASPGGGSNRPSGDPNTLSLKDNKAAFDELKRCINECYSYKDLHSLDWEALYKEYEPKLLAAKSPKQFARTAGDLLANAKDKHIWLKVDDEQMAVYRNPVTPNANFQQLPTLIPEFKKRNSTICTGRFPGGIGYIYIDNWNSGQKADFDALYAALDEFADTKGLIIDVRGNGGGSEPLAQEFAGCFVDEPKLYSKHVYRESEEPNGFGQVHERVLEPNKTKPPYRGKAAVLTGPVVMSSCESFVLMMKQAPGCVLVGEPTQGSSGNPKPHDLGNKVTVYLPSWKDMLPDGSCLEGVGIQPDILVKVRPEQITAKDPVIEAALEVLRRK
jgi:hypothetical protein